MSAGSMAQFGQMGLNHFSQMYTPQIQQKMPMNQGQGQSQQYPVNLNYGQMVYPGQVMMPIQPGMVQMPIAQSGQGSMQMMPGQMPMFQSQIQPPGYFIQQPMQQGDNNQMRKDQDFGFQQIRNSQNIDEIGEGGGGRNMNIQQQAPLSKPSEGFRQEDRYAKANKQKDYSHMLEQQMELKKQKLNELKNYESLEIERLKQERMRSQPAASIGQIARDVSGNLLNAKANPNYQAQDWFSHVAHKDEFAGNNNARAYQPIPVQQSVPNLATYDQDLRRQRELESRLQTSSKVTQMMVNQNQEKIMKAQEAFQKSTPQVYPQTQDIQLGRAPPFFGGENDVLKQRKRQEFLELQREQLEQIEEKKRQKELKALQEKRERELDDLKIERERQEIQLRMQGDYQNNRRGHRNLQETNFDTSTVSQFTQQQPQQTESVPIKSALKKRTQTPPENNSSDTNMQSQGDNNFVTLNNNNNTKLSVMSNNNGYGGMSREVSAEIQKTVQENVGQEIIRLRNEMNLHSNSLGEQILGMRQQLMHANERRNQAEDGVLRLQEELKKTRIIDEIRNRELFNAFASTEKNKYKPIDREPPLLYNMPSLYDETQTNKELPTQLKPSQNMRDSYIENYDFKKAALEQDAQDLLMEANKRSIPISDDFQRESDRPNQDIVGGEKYFYDTQAQRDLAKRMLELKSDAAFELSDDYKNRQDLFLGKSQQLSEGNGNFEDYKKGIERNQNEFDNLEEVNIYSNTGALDKMDEALFDLAKHSQQEVRFKKRYDQEENLQDIEDYVNFNSKLMRRN